jgi:hypothetical protein
LSLSLEYDLRDLSEYLSLDNDLSLVLRE